VIQAEKMLPSSCRTGEDPEGFGDRRGADVQQLRDDASDDALRDGCAENHIVWAERQAAVLGGGPLPQPEGVRAVAIGATEPHVLAALMHEPGPETGPTLADIVDTAAGSRATRLSVWAVRDRYVDAVEPWIGPRGGRRGGRPHWMVLDCRTYDLPATPSAGEAAFTTPQTFGGHVEPELHCYHPELSSSWQRMTEIEPRRVWHAVQWRDGLPVGQVSIHATEGELGVVGLHDAVFVRSARARGPGLDRFDFFVRFARALGSRYIVINAAAHTAMAYRALGFRSLGHGQTWWFSCDGLQRRPSADEVAFGEAVATGDFSRVHRGARDVDAPLANGLTPLRYAAETGRSDSADRLLRQGARPDLLAFWDLGRRDEMAALLAADPGLVAVRGRRSGKTLLHAAVERGDVELTRFLLAAGADADALDDEFGATPLAWAVELRQFPVASVLRKVRSTA
jgi:hypothetical protein